MNKTIERLKKAVGRTKNYEEFEKLVLSYVSWYLDGLQAWTKADLRQFYQSVTGKEVLVP